MAKIPEFHAAKWNEPVVMEMGRPGARGQLFPAPESEVTEAVGSDLIPASMQRKDRAELPEITEFEAQRHYLHLSQMTLGMMGVSLFGTCTMKYNSKTAISKDSVVTASSRSVPVRPGVCCIDSKKFSTLRWVSCTPLGLPVEPEV